MEDFFARLVQDLSERLSGPLRFRFVLQPLMASILAIRAGIKDAREGRPPYFWEMFTNREAWKELAHEGWKAIAKIFTIAIIMDVIYQLIVSRWVLIFETVVIAMLLAVVPYLLLRGPVNRIFRAWGGPPSQTAGSRRVK
jgi:hypothetical protein